MSGGRVVPDVLAAVDLGSNSFHMVVARYSHGQLVILDRLREMVRLAAGMGDGGRLDDAATDRALRCLERFGQRLRAMQANSVRVVGTNALRRAKRKRWFLESARAALGPCPSKRFGISWRGKSTPASTFGKEQLPRRGAASPSYGA